jgi:AcrR family transcriptional regulator
MTKQNQKKIATAPRKKKASENPTITTANRKRLDPNVRRAQILDAAARLIVKQGFLPLSIEALAQDAEASKALIYTYFANQHELFNALLKREIAGIATAGIDTASQVNDLEQAAVLCGMLYFEHVANCGPLFQILMTDLYMSDHIADDTTRDGKAILQRLVRLARKNLKLTDKEIVAAIEMIATIPEEAGSLAFHKELDLTTARQLCHALMLASLQSLKSPGRVTVSPDHVS